MSSGDVISIDAWWSQGRLLPVRGLDGGAYDLFVHDAGTGPLVTFLHGYPSSSYDWHDVVQQLAGQARTLAPDFLGFGASSKPSRHAWSIHEQADLVQQLWHDVGMTSTVLVAHDYGTAVAQELLARGARGITGLVLTNGAVYPTLHRPTAVQQLLLGPDGPALAAAIERTSFIRGLRATFGQRAPATQDQLEHIWQALSRDDGQRLAADLLHYVADRAEHGQRWVDAMEATQLPLSFVWGQQDPVSGAHVLAQVQRRMPRAAVRALPDVGHWPPLEAPADMADAVRTLFGSPAPAPLPPSRLREADKLLRRKA